MANGTARLLRGARRRARTPRTTRSRRPTASSPASGTRTATTTTPTPRSASRRSRRPTTRSRTPRSASSTTPAACSGSAAPAAAPGLPAAASRGGGFASDLGDIFGQFFSARRPAAAAGAARPRPRGRGRSSASTRRWAAPRSRSRCRPPRPAATCAGIGREAGHLAAGLPALRRPRRRLREPGLLLDPAAVPRVRRPGHRSSTSPARPARAAGIIEETKRYRVNIPAGVHDGSRIRLAGKGEAGYRGGPRGDLYVTTRVAPSPVFRQRPDGNLEVDLPVSVTEAIQGATIEVPTLNGSKRIKIAAGHPARDHPAAARRGPAPHQGRRARRHPLPGAARGPDGADRRAARGGRAPRRGLQRREPARVAAAAAGPSGRGRRVSERWRAEARQARARTIARTRPRPASTPTAASS